MNITNTCVNCIIGQIEKATKILNLNKNLADEIMLEVKGKAKDFDFGRTPPFVAKEVYELLAQKTGLKDPLEHLKQESIKNAVKHVPLIEDKITKSKDKLFTAIKAAVAGNVIDFAVSREFCLDKEIENIFHTDFAINCYEDFKSRLEKEDRLLILSDNAGENVFDKVLIKTIKELYPNKEVIYATRGKAIINDITTKEALQIGIDEHCRVMSSGVDTPGMEKSQASKEFMEIFEKAPLILSKGMGNFECLESYNDKRIYFLFKVKCEVVASKIGREIGEIVLKQG